MPNPTLDQFEAAFRTAQQSWNRGRFREAYADLAPDCEYRPWDAFLSGEAAGSQRTGLVLVGPAEVARYFEEIFAEFPDFSNEPVRFLDAGDGVFVVLNHARGSGRTSGAPVAVSHGALWRLRDGVVVSVREFATWEEALSAAGLDPSLTAEIRGRQAAVPGASSPASGNRR